MIGDRIRMKRRAAGYSLQDLAHYIEKSGTPITRAALSNYETGKTAPSEHILKAIATVLGTSVEYLEEEVFREIEIRYFSKTDLIPKKWQELHSFVQLCVEKFITLNSILEISSPTVFNAPFKVKACNLDEVETLAEKVRCQLGLGEMPISSVCAVLESNGWYVFEVLDAIGKKIVSGIVEKTQTPFLGFFPFDTIDSLRFEMLQEVGNAYLVSSDMGVLGAATARFADAMLFPRKQVLKEFGEKRENISFYELALAKQKYGISKMRIAGRLQCLGIISKKTADLLVMDMQQKGFLTKKNQGQDMLYFYEYPESLRMKYLHAEAEGLISAEQNRILQFFQSY